jgi:hypothetical protein
LQARKYAHLAHNVTDTPLTLFGIGMCALYKALDFPAADDEYIIFFGNLPRLFIFFDADDW